MYEKISVPNERSRVYLSVALVDNNSISIDKPSKRFGNILDTSYSNGQKFTDKAPGAGFFGALVYGTARIFTSSQDWTIVELINLIRTFLMIPLGLLGFFLLRRLLLLHKLPLSIINIVSIGFILGSTAFHYSTVFYGHQIVSVLFLFALLSFEYSLKSTSKLKSALLVFSSACAAGMAGFTEYQSGIFCVSLLAIVIYSNRKKPINIIAFASGASIFVGLLLLYNYFAFQSPFELSYHHLSKSMQGRHSSGIAGVSYPDIKALKGILFSLHRGIFISSPFYLLALPGFYFLWRSNYRKLALLLGFSFLGYLVFISGAKIWHGGWAFGSRLLVPLLGVLCLPVAYTFNHYKNNIILSALFVGLVISGIIYNQISHVVFQEFPTHCFNPLMDVILPAFVQETFSPNIFSKYWGVSDYISIVPFAFFLIVILFLLIRTECLCFSKQEFKKIVLLACAPVLVLFLIIIIYGTSWGPKKQNKFLKWMNKLEHVHQPISKTQIK